MGKAFNWIRALLGCKNSDPNPLPPHRPPTKKRWTFAAICHKKKDRRKSLHGGGYDGEDASRQAIVVAAATAAAAEAAVKAAQAAAAVVRLTTTRSENGGGFNSAARGGREERAAVTIQSHFRAYLSRRALRALKALVKIQALVRGHITRKKAADDLRRMHAIVRAQARARAGRRVPISEGRHSIAKSSHFNHSALMTWEKFEQRIRAGTAKHEQPMMLKRNGLKSFERSWDDDGDDERSDKILEVDSGRPPHLTPKMKNRISHSCQLPRNYGKLLSSPSSSGEVQSLRRLKFGQDHTAEDDSTVPTSENSPLIYSPSHSSKTALFTPTKSDGSRSCMSGYSDHPNYMAYTESAKAKTRSLSAPKQRPGHQYERSSSMSRYSSVQVNDGGDDSRTSKGYPGSGRLDRHGMPVGRDVSSFSGGHWLRY